MIILFISNKEWMHHMLLAIYNLGIQIRVGPGSLVFGGCFKVVLLL